MALMYQKQPYTLSVEGAIIPPPYKLLSLNIDMIPVYTEKDNSLPNVC